MSSVNQKPDCPDQQDEDVSQVKGTATCDVPRCVRRQSERLPDYNDSARDKSDDECRVVLRIQNAHCTIAWRFSPQYRQTAVPQ